MKKTLGIAILALGLPALTLAGPGDWTFLASVDGAASGNGVLGTIRAEADSAGQVYLSIANTTVTGVYKSSDFVSAVTASPAVAPTWSEVHSDAAMANGFQGIAPTSGDDVFLVADNAAGNDGLIVKYASDGTQDATFGSITPVPRLTGADVMSDGSLLATTFGGVFYKYDAANGTELANVDTVAGNFCRDLAIKQDILSGNDIIFLNKSGDLKMVTGGSASDISGYTTVADLGTGIVNSDTTWEVRPGVDYFPTDDTVIYTNMTDMKVYVVNVSDGTLAQEIDITTQIIADNADGVSDVAAFSIGNDDFLVIANSELGGVLVYSKTNTSAVQDWMMLQ